MAPHVLLALLASAAASAAAQDVSDCTWQPEAEDTAELECRLKTLQTGPAVIPQVRSSATNEPLSSTIQTRAVNDPSRSFKVAREGPY